MLYGSADAVADPRNARRLAATIPDADAVRVPATGHLPGWEQPDAFAGTVTAFLEEDPGRRDDRGVGGYAMAPLYSASV